VILPPGINPFEFISNPFADPCNEKVVTLGGDSFRDCSNLIVGLAFTVNDFGKSFAQRPMMIDFGKADIFKGKMSERLENFAFASLTFFEFTKEFL
jgi:hypothetical protein